MIRTKHAWAVALALSCMTSAASAAPATAAGPDEEPEMRVVNNHEYRVRVILVDKAGRHHSLGVLAPNRAAEYDLDRFAEYGLPLQVKVVVDEPVWSPGATERAVRSGSLYISDHTEVRVWVESDLTETQVEVHNWG